ncbi:NAD-dependent protein deacetylase, SIR2 family [Noviherbaspirillum humi]|uniref:protein acetyllysine N-acetyltransferase n=1 Tax=Noviherbaspirillum humi TaxID=1688639 RepID=A0A239BZJ4_9BURK|nr:Sir2 family NAD-dependent protein deacetylase [Noviherbaspirillum humi]SNS13485.1 NAD-dependent protein deacetylase, SIR2 family [Noviherbaspirillum humi]
MNLDAQAAQAAAWIADADALLITAGAGMGTDSGLPTFRGDEGFWNAYPPLRQARLSFTDIANPQAFRDDAQLAWGFYGHRLAMYRRTPPHAGHALLQRMAEKMPNGAFVFTSNVDGHFGRAGFDEERVVECHGSIHFLQCSRPCAEDIWPAKMDVEVDESRCRLLSPLPRCPRCDAVARPNILMFGDGEWLGRRTAAQSARLQQWLRRVGRPLVIELGAGTAVPTVRRLGEAIGSRLIRINPFDPQLDAGAGIGMACGALQGLHAIAARL